MYPITDEVLDRTADLWVEARRGGHPHRDPDLIIAATALHRGYGKLVTGNTAHFAWIPGLTVKDGGNRSRSARARPDCSARRSRFPSQQFPALS